MKGYFTSDKFDNIIIKAIEKSSDLYEIESNITAGLFYRDYTFKTQEDIEKFLIDYGIFGALKEIYLYNKNIFKESEYSQYYDAYNIFDVLWYVKMLQYLKDIEFNNFIDSMECSNILTEKNKAEIKNKFKKWKI